MTEKNLRITMTFIGVVLTGISVGIFQTVALGTDPLTCLITALSNFFNSTYGVWYTIVTGGLLVAVFFTRRRYIGIATFLSLFLIGFMADFTHWLLDLVLVNPSMTFRIILILFNVVLLSLAASLYFTADLGVSSYDAVSLMAANDYKVAPFRICRVSSDLFCVFVGSLNGADIGVGTLITACMMGPIIQFFNDNLSVPLLKAKQMSEHVQFPDSSNVVATLGHK